MVPLVMSSESSVPDVFTLTFAFVKTAVPTDPPLMFSAPPSAVTVSAVPATFITPAVISVFEATAPEFTFRAA